MKDDIFILRQLGGIYIDLEEYERAEQLIQALEMLDATAFERDVESAALYGKFCLNRRKDTAAALDVYSTALNHNPESYYLANLGAEALLSAGDTDRARQ